MSSLERSHSGSPHPMDPGDLRVPSMSGPDSGADFVLTVPSKPRYLKAIRSFFRAALAAEDCGEQVQHLVLALDESCSNAMKYRSTHSAAPDRVQIEARVRTGSVRFEISDFCRPEDVPNIKPRDLDDIRPGGLGTFLIAKIMDRVRFELDEKYPGRMALVMEKSWTTEACQE